MRHLQKKGPWSYLYFFIIHTFLNHYKVQENKTLTVNPYGWTEDMSILYLESPIGVGFSYSTDPNDKDKIGDYSTTIDTESALGRFLEKFPKYGTKDFYIMGRVRTRENSNFLNKCIQLYSKIKF